MMRKIWMSEKKEQMNDEKEEMAKFEYFLNISLKHFKF